MDSATNPRLGSNDREFDSAGQSQSIRDLFGTCNGPIDRRLVASQSISSANIARWCKYVVGLSLLGRIILEKAASGRCVNVDDQPPRRALFNFTFTCT